MYEPFSLLYDKLLNLYVRFIDEIWELYLFCLDLSFKLSDCRVDGLVNTILLELQESQEVVSVIGVLLVLGSLVLEFVLLSPVCEPLISEFFEFLIEKFSLWQWFVPHILHDIHIIPSDRLKSVAYVIV